MSTATSVGVQVSTNSHTADTAKQHKNTGDHAFDDLFNTSVSQQRDHDEQTESADPTQQAQEQHVTEEIVSVELWHAAGIDLAALNAQQLATRGGQTDAALEAQQPKGDSPATAQRNNAPANAPAHKPTTSGVQPSVPNPGDLPQPPSGPTNGTPSDAPRAGRNANAPHDAGDQSTPNQVTGLKPGSHTLGTLGHTDPTAGTAARPTAPGARPGVAPITPSIAPGTAVKPLTSPLRANPAGPAQLTTNQRSFTPPFSAQIQRGLAQLIRQEGGTMTLRLVPDALGELTVVLKMEDGHASAMFRPTTQQAYELLNAHLTDLRAALEARGLEVSRLIVEPPPEQDGPPREHAATRNPAEPGDAHKGGGSPEDEAQSETAHDGRRSSPHDHPGQDAPQDRGEAPGTTTAPVRTDDAHAGLEPDADHTPRERTPDGRWIRLDTVA